MIRTMLSFCLLFGGLLLGSKWLHESVASPPARAPITNEETAPALAPIPLDAKLIPLDSSSPPTAAIAPELRTIQLITYDELTEVLNSLRPANKSAAGRSAEPDASDEAVTDGKDAAYSEGVVTVPIAAKAPEIVLTPELAALRWRLRECLAYYYFRPENVAVRSPWGAMHAMIAYGVDSELIVGDRRVNAIGYLNYNGMCSGQQLFYTEDGRLQTRIGPGVQGHPGQYLAMLAQSRVMTSFPMLIEGQRFTVADLIQHEKETCKPKTELTFKLIAFTHYLKSNERWRSNDGQEWDIPRLIKEELAQPIVGAACGGTHRLTGFSYAVRKRQQRGEPFTGQWERARLFIEDFHDYAFRLQNPDGSFSTDWFAGRADNGPLSKHLETTGHITEWLAYSLSKEELVKPEMIRSVSYLTNLLLDYRDEKWAIGPLGHGLHALALYDERIFGGQPGTRAVELAKVLRQRGPIER